eukprot:s1356_g10.t1
MFHEASDIRVPTTWAISETHLTDEGTKRFRQELKFQSPQWKFIPGAPAPPLTNAPGCVGGKATGVGLLTNNPARALPNDWDVNTWETGRLQTCAVHVQQQWVKVGMCYGYAKQFHTRATREATDQILENVSERIIFQSRGLRILCGDLNQEDYESLEQFSIWRDHGFAEIQDVAAQKFGHVIAPTCHGKTKKDQMWLSPELIPYLKGVTVDSTYFPDHAIVVGEFHEFGRTPPVPIWRKPMPLPWEKVDLPALQGKADAVAEQVHSITEVFSTLESLVDAQLRHQGEPGLVPQQRGRCQTTQVTVCKHGITPNRPSRKHDVQITYMGEHFVHTKWCRQLRRLQSLCRLMKCTHDRPHIAQEKSDLWEAIKRAPGFPGGFAAVWKGRAHVSPAAPCFIPKKVPPLEVAELIFHDFRVEFQQLEKLLINARCKQAREVRAANCNAIYRDVSKPRSLPVSTVVVNRNVIVTDVSVDGLQIKYEPSHLSLDEHVHAKLGVLPVASHSAGQLTLESPQALEPGDHMSQPKMLGDLPDVFRAFEELWRPMWQRHKNKDVAEWLPVLADLQARVPVPPQPIEMPPITAEQWMKAVQSKKSTSATGPDGVSKLDLLNMPPKLVNRLVDFVNSCERGDRDWPQPSMVGLIASIEKHSAAASPSEFRPITVLSMVYRTYSSIRTKQILRWIHSFAPDGLFGNMPHQSTVQVWRALAEQIEHANYFDCQWTGAVTDVTKCFNTLPRHVVYFLGRHLGLPEHFMKSWHHNLSMLQRRFIVQGSCSPAIDSQTGYAEGDPLSVAAMAILNCAMHHVVTSQVSPVRVISYVDNWELQSSQPEATCAAYEAMDRFAQSLDIKLDAAKSHFWGTTAQSRKELKVRGRKVLLHCKDLGGHLNYSKRGTNYSLRARITNTKPMWGWLSRSQATSCQKLRVLYTVAWPRCLHGIAGVDIGTDHFTTLRAAAMNALRWEKHGSSSLLQFGLLTSARHDPQFYALITTVMQFRQHCAQDTAFAVLDQLATQPPVRYYPGPSGVLLARLHAIQWRWEGNGYVTDHQGLVCHLLDSPIQFLRIRLEQAWAAYVGQKLSDRDEFQGLAEVDILCSRHTAHKFSPTDQGLLRVAMNGSFYTRDKQFSSGKFTSKKCPWCSAEDSVHHRTWECPHFAEERSRLTEEHRHYIMSQPDCTKLHGWFVETDTDRAYRRALFAIAHNRDFYLWTDCQLVFDRVFAMSTGDFEDVSAKQKDHDLWQELALLMRTCCRRKLFQRVLKVSSHQDAAQYSNVVDEWAFRGNEAADSLAIQARHLLPPQVLHAHRRLVTALTLRYSACVALHTLFVDIGKKVVSEKKQLRDQEEKAWEQMPPQVASEEDRVSFASLPEGLAEPSDNPLGEGFSILYDWLLRLTTEANGSPTWLSSYQLYALFQDQTGHLGFSYSRKNKTYESLEHAKPKDYSFIRSAGWFNAMVKCFAKLVEQECTIQARKPAGVVFKCWQRRSRVRWLLVRWSHQSQGFQANPTEHYVRLISWFRLCSSLVEHFPVEVLSQLLPPLLSPAYRCTSAFRGVSLPDVVSLEQALALGPAQRRGFLANLAQSFIDATSEKMTAAGRAADFAQALNRIRKAVEHRRQERVQKRRLQPVTNPEAAAATRRAKNRRRAEGKKRKMEELIHNTKGGRGKQKVKQSKSLIS